MAKQILKNGGALISEFEPNMKAAPYTFPKRNRIIAGMSKAVLIVEATPKSGTLITARLAMEYNRDVMTVPGSIYSNSSHGPHMLIKNGAALIESGKDIVQVLGFTEEMSKKPKTENLSEVENSIIKALSSPASKEELIESLKIPITALNITLSALELKGLVEVRLGKIHLS